MPRADKKNEFSFDFLSAIDFGIEVFMEKKPGNGEDSFLYSYDRKGCIVGVFDGCGGSGAKKYEKFRGKTGAYMASRVVAGATKDWFDNGLAANNSGETGTEQLKRIIKEYLGLCREIGGSTSSIKGSLSKDFPTTAAIICTNVVNNRLQATCIWAGDSRCYLLDEEGLKQLSEDDLNCLDAMENLSADGVLTNVISTSKDFVLHQKTITISKPSILFTATDGCFGYFSTPMEFEYLLLSALFSSESVAQWENAISEVLQEVAGDDFSLSGVSIGFGTMSNLKKSLGKRFSDLFSTYIVNLKDKTQEEKYALWGSYKTTYNKYLSEG